MTGIRKVRTPDEINAARDLARDFVAFLHQRYPEMQAEIDDYLTRQDFEGQLRAFAAHFGPPGGECLIADHRGQPAGVVMLKALDGPACEMNRLFVRPEARGAGLGRALCEALFREAYALGYREIRLSALYRHVEALALYRALGFVECRPFERGGDGGDDRIIFMSRRLDDTGAGRHDPQGGGD
ncbi:GNAT family N-acetyltransferase [Limibaculum sp. M0105]|uniref:GNAT family N-acetyltransferase n=1 Tax=Thermohalobaculum xanthum TaxID=2753746 RepID=A0A8J7M5E9_9RHOB|nr:GNAT family N-acetyltransferase [Thermohalobaculum xanthum]MBK0398684.1 GNAT family N-acetyltransferase [Thermohalobaculum xanthum]